MPLSDQQVINQFANNMRTQGVRSVNAYGQCVYRGPNGVKCGVGGFIPDDWFTPSMEYQVVGAIWPGIKDLFESDDSSLLSMLQNIHDSEHSWDDGFSDEGEQSLASLCAYRELTYPEKEQS